MLLHTVPKIYPSSFSFINGGTLYDYFVIVIISNDLWISKTSMSNIVFFFFPSAGAGQEVTDFWYAEIAKFDFNNPCFVSGTGE